MPSAAPADTAPRLLRFRDWSCVRHGLVWAYDDAVLRKARQGVYTNPDFSCWLVRRGQVTLTTGRQTVVARAGQWAFVACPTRRQNFSEDARILSIHFHFSWPGGEPVIAQPRNVVFSAADHPRLDRAARPIARLVTRHFPGAGAFLSDSLCTLPVYLRAQSLLPLWLDAYLETQAALGNFPRRLGLDDDRMLHAFAELDRQPLDEKFSEKRFVAASGLGRSQLNALFVRSAGTTPRRYFEKRRLEAAQRLLSGTRASVKEIALDLGFRHVAHFSAWFSRLTGASPTQTRASSPAATAAKLR